MEPGSDRGESRNEGETEIGCSTGAVTSAPLTEEPWWWHIVQLGEADGATRREQQAFIPHRARLSHLYFCR